MKKQLILSSVLAILLCVSLIAGASFAIFTSGDNIDVSVTSGTVQFDATVLTNTLAAFSLDVDQNGTVFENGGEVEFDANTNALVITNITPGDEARFTIRMTNTSNVKVQYRVKWAVEDTLLNTGLVATADGNRIVNNVSAWTEWDIPADPTVGETKDIEVSVELPYTAGNDYQNKTANIYFTVEAVQGNAIVEDVSTFEQLDVALSMGVENVSLTENIVIPEGKTIVVPADAKTTLDLGAYTIDAGYQTGSTAKHTYAIDNYGDLTIKGDGVINARGIGNYGKLTIDGGTFNAIDTNGGASVWQYAGELVINGGTFTSAAASQQPAASCVYVAENSTATINGGTFTANASLTYAIIVDGNITINDATVTSHHGALSLTSNGEMTVNGGTFTADGTAGHVVYASAGTTTINGGSFTHTVSPASGGNCIIYVAKNTSAAVVVTGGEFNAVSASLSASGMNLTVKGGTFTNDPTAFLANGCTVNQNANGNYVVVAP